jgi:hypothetical protein
VRKSLAVILKTFHACLQIDSRTDLYKQVAVSCWSVTSEAQVGFRVRPCEICRECSTWISSAIMFPLVLTSLLCLHTAIVKVIKWRIVQTFKQSSSFRTSGSIRQRSACIFVFMSNLSVPHPLTPGKWSM